MKFSGTERILVNSRSLTRGSSHEPSVNPGSPINLDIEDTVVNPEVDCCTKIFPVMASAAEAKLEPVMPPPTAPIGGSIRKAVLVLVVCLH